MKKVLVLVFLITLLIAGLNGVAAGMHRLLPSSPPCVIGWEKNDRGVELKFMEKTIYIGP